MYKIMERPFPSYKIHKWEERKIQMIDVTTIMISYNNHYFIIINESIAGKALWESFSKQNKANALLRA